MDFKRRIEELISKEISNTLNQGKKMTDTQVSHVYPYSSIEDYKQQTGKRFRVSREQKARIEEGVLTREEAFQEFLENLSAPQNTETQE